MNHWRWEEMSKLPMVTLLNACGLFVVDERRRLGENNIFN
jgi:hypothetical protein